jgi:hypothetical protein
MMRRRKVSSVGSQRDLWNVRQGASLRWTLMSANLTTLVSTTRIVIASSLPIAMIRRFQA